MKRFGVLLGVAIGLIAYQGQQMPAYAASGAAQATGSGAADVDGAKTYANRCAMCHGPNREGSPPMIPSLVGITGRMTNQQITDMVHNGRGRMPGIPTLQGEELTTLLHYLEADPVPAPAGTAKASSSPAASHPMSLAETGDPLFQQNCGFCHGRDAEGGESGPDLTRSRLVRTDTSGDRIAEVLRNGRPEKKMPAFSFSPAELHSLVAFIHSQEAKAVSQKGGRRGVEVADLQTGNVEAGKKYFNGEGTCAKCHSATGDFADLASRYEGLQLEERMLYPRDAKSLVTVTLPSGQKVSGTLVYQDEFTVGLRDATGEYHSWSIGKMKYAIDSPVEAHADLFSKYTDADIHNLMAYLQTLR